MSTNSNVVALKPKALSDEQAAKKLRESGYSEEKHQETVRKSYDNLIEKGLRPVLLKTGIKAPLGDNWLKKEVPARHDFEGYHNIGIITGEAGGGVVDIDVDIEELIPIIGQFLPPTPFKFGRYYGGEQLKLSHWLYRVKLSDCVVTVVKQWRRVRRLSITSWVIPLTAFDGKAVRFKPRRGRFPNTLETT